MKIRERLTQIGSLITFWWFYLGAVASAQGFGQDRLQGLGKAVYGEGEEAKARDFTGILGTLIKTAISLLGIVFLVLVVYAGYLWLTARGEEDMVKRAKDTLKRAVIGLIIVISAYALVTFLFERLTKLPAAT